MKNPGHPLAHRRATIIGSIAALHFLLTVALLFLSGASTMSRFDGGGPSDLTAAIINGAFDVATFPLVQAFLWLKIAGSGIWGWLVFFANSLFWGWVGWRLIRSRRSRTATVPSPT